MLTGLAQEASGGSGGLGFMFWVVLIGGGALLWTTFSRSRKLQRGQVDVRNSLAPGDEVMTGSGLYGTVVSADGDVIVLETSPGVEQRWARAAVARKVDPLPEETDPGAVEDEPEFDEFEVPDDPSSLDPDDKKP
ncbi:MAG: preprotein translocase subunit YajC [Micrococcales bacterium]|nr:preprotein translocase subunit YajC [Micrococcales bacterium]